MTTVTRLAIRWRETSYNCVFVVLVIHVYMHIMKLSKHARYKASVSEEWYMTDYHSITRVPVVI